MVIYREGSYEIKLIGGDKAEIHNGSNKSVVKLVKPTSLPSPVMSKLKSMGANPNDYVWVGSSILRKDALEAWNKALTSKSTNKKLPRGLNELREAYDLSYDYNRSVVNMLDSEKQPKLKKEVDIKKLEKMYPEATVYIMAETFEQASNYNKKAAGKQARELIEAGGGIKDALEILKNWSR